MKNADPIPILSHISRIYDIYNVENAHRNRERGRKQVPR